MQYLSLCKIEQFVEKYIIIQSSLDDLINNCNRIIHDHHITILLPLNAYQESYSLIQQLMISFFTLQPQQDQMNEDQEPKIIIKDNLQSSVKVEIHPVSQQEFLTSLTKFRNISHKSSLKSSVNSFRKSSLNKYDRQQQTQQGSFHITFSPIPLQNYNQEDDDDRFYRGVYEMKKKQQEQLRFNKQVSETEKVQLQLQLLELKRKYKNGVLTFDNDGSIIMTKQKVFDSELHVYPDCKIFPLNLKNQEQKSKLQTQITNIVSSSIQRKQRLEKIVNNIKSDIRMETEPVRINQSFNALNNQDLKSKSFLKQLLNDQSLKMTKKEFSQIIGLEHTIGDVLHEKLQRMTQIQQQRAQYREQQHSRNITPLINEDHKEDDTQKNIFNRQEGKITLIDSRFLDQIPNDNAEVYFQNFSEKDQIKNNQSKQLDLPYLQQKAKQSKYAILRERKQQKLISIVKLRSYTTQE